jgi:Na+/proline symporter
MKLTLIDWLIIFLVPLVALIANYIYKRINPGNPSRRNFGLANQNLGGVAVASTYIGANITFTSIFIILSQEGYKRGYWALTVPLFWIIGTFIFLYLYPRIKEFIINGNTLHQAIGETFKSSSLKFYASIWTVLSFVLTVSLEFYGGIKLISVANVPFLSYFSIGIIFIIIIGYFTAKGGFGGVAYADIAMDIISILGISFLTGAFFSFLYQIFSNSFPEIITTNENIAKFPTIDENIIFTISMLILFLPFQFVTFDSWQRLSARKSREKSPNTLIFSSGLVVSIIFCIPVFLGIYMRSKDIFIDIEHNELVLLKFLQYMNFQPVVIGIVVAGFIAAVFSTADELLNCSSYSFLSDALEIEEDNNTTPGKLTIDYSYKFYVILFTVISTILAFIGLIWKEKEITDIGLAIFSTQIVFVLPLFFVFFNRESAYKYELHVKYSMITAFIFSFLFVILGWIIKEKAFVEGAPIGAFIFELLTFGILRIFVKPKK